MLSRMAAEPKLVLDPARLHEVLRLDAETGRLYWRERPMAMFAGKNPRRAGVTWNKRWAGKEAFTTLRPDGYWASTVFAKHYLAHRVVWAMVHGAWPEADLDHVNHDRADNRPSNLRDVDHQTNHRNQNRRKNNTSGVMGVYWQKNRKTWNATIFVDGVSIHQGAFQTYDAAVSARRAAEREYGFHENHGAVAA